MTFWSLFDSTLMTDWYKDWLIRLRSGMVVKTGLSDLEVEWLPWRMRLRSGMVVRVSRLGLVIKGSLMIIRMIWPALI